MKQYNKEEIEILKTYYPKEGVRGVQKHIDRTHDSIRHKAKSLGITRIDGFRESHKDLNYLINPKTEIAAYILGLIWGDGTLNILKNNKGYNTSVTLQEKDFFELKEKGVFENFNIHKVKKMKESWKQTYCAGIGHKKFALFLRDNDYKTKSLVSPCKILNKIPKKFHVDFIRGWFDADGSSNTLRKRNFSITFSGSHKQSWKALRDFCRDSNIKYSVKRTSSKWGNYSLFTLRKKEGVIKFFNLIYKSGPYLQRKYENFLLID
jgi:DNA-binding transcriptional regulator WhiA